MAKKAPAKPTRSVEARRRESEVPRAKAPALDKKQAERLKAQREKERLKVEREKLQAKKQAEREKERLKAQREKERLKAEREKLQAKKQAERARAEQKVAAEREKAKLKAEEQARREKELEERKRRADAKRLQEKAEKDRIEAERREQREREAEQRRQAAEAQKLEREQKKQEEQARKQAERAAREEEQARLKAQREAEREAQRQAKEDERQRLKAERDAEKQRVREEKEAEREREREEKRRKREEDRARREAELAAYRKAKEAEQAKIRAEREAARRALEGRVARATGRGIRGARATTTTRVYSPASIPDQSGTRRGLGSEDAMRLTGIRPTPRPPPEPVLRPRTLPPPPPPVVEPPATVEERYALVLERLRNVSDEFRAEYEENFLMSWIHHDSALEGVVYTYEELRTAVNPNITVVPDSSLQSVCEEIRRHKAAIEFVRDYGERKRAPVTLDHLKRIYLILHPEEGDLKTVRYRKDVPQHRMYFHEYAAPDKIPYKVRQIFDWLNGPEPKKLKNPLRIAAKVHYDLLRVFPFAKDSGKVVRLFMNMLLLRADYPPAILHSTERQRYYEALKGSPTVLFSMLQAALMNALQSIEKKLDERETRLRAIIS